MKNKSLFPYGEIVRRVQFEGETYYSIIDIIHFLMENEDPQSYWMNLKAEDKQLINISHVVEMANSTGQLYPMECVNTEGVFRLIMPIPSLKAEPIKRWLAKIANRKLEEINKPELVIERLSQDVNIYTKSMFDNREILEELFLSLEKNVMEEVEKMDKQPKDKDIATIKAEYLLKITRKTIKKYAKEKRLK